MRYIFLCLLVALTGCANLSQLLTPESDPTVVRAENIIKSAELAVPGFLNLMRSSPNDGNLEAKALARSLTDRFPVDLATLKSLLVAYKQTRSPYAKTSLLPAIDTVKASRDVAEMYSTEWTLERGGGPPFAPAIPPDMNALLVQMSEMRDMLRVLNERVRVLSAPPPPPMPPSPTVK